MRESRYLLPHQKLAMPHPTAITISIVMLLMMSSLNAAHSKADSSVCGSDPVRPSPAGARGISLASSAATAPASRLKTNQGSASQDDQAEAADPSLPAIDGSTTEDLREPLAKTNVGMMAQINELKLAGSLLEVSPIEDRDTPIVVRIVRTFPHGTDHRYDIEFYGLEPGTYNLLDYLQREDGSSMEGLEPVTVVVEPLLPEGQVEPHRPELGPLPQFMRYRMLMIGLGVAWLLGLGLILFWKRRGKEHASETLKRPQTLADQLRPLVDRAVSGEATPQELASLERSLITFWRKRLDLESLPASEAIHHLRSHPEAGGLISQLESWLHQPGRESSVPIEALLMPYRNIAKQDLESLDPKAKEIRG